MSRISRFTAWLSRPAAAWGLGIVMPIVMVVKDPCILRGYFTSNSQVFGAMAPGAYCAISLGMVALAYHLRSKRSSAFIAGVLAAATLFAAVLGVVMVPISILGIVFFGIGLLGFSPFFTALVFGPQARRAFQDSPTDRRVWRFLCGVLLYFGICMLVQWRVDAVRQPLLMALPTLSAAR